MTVCFVHEKHGSAANKKYKCSLMVYLLLYSHTSSTLLLYSSFTLFSPLVKLHVTFCQEVRGTTSVWLKFMETGSPQPGGRAFRFSFPIVCTNLSIICQT